MVDITNASYSGEISLQPFTGLVLLGVGTVTESGGEPPAAVSGFGKVGTKFGKYNGKLAGYNN
jgi:hypothetical protein